MASQTVIELTDSNFEELALKSDKPVLVDFWASWCAPCKVLMPLLEKITESFGGELLLAKVDCDAEAFLTERFGIRSLPTVVLFKDGQPVDGFAGAQPESAIRAMLEQHASAPEQTAEADGEDIETTVSELLTAGQPEQAIALLQQAMAEGTSDPLLLLLARALMDTSQFDDAQAVLDSIQDKDTHKQALAALRAGNASAPQIEATPVTPED